MSQPAVRSGYTLSGTRNQSTQDPRPGVAATYPCEKLGRAAALASLGLSGGPSHGEHLLPCCFHVVHVATVLLHYRYQL